MLIHWTPSARQALAQIGSVRFTQEETKLYLKCITRSRWISEFASLRH